MAGLFQAAQKAELTNIVKLRSKRVFRHSPSERNEKTPLGSNCTRSVSYHHFGWAFPSSAKSRIDEYRQIEFKTRFSTFPIGAKRKNTLGIKIHEVGFIPLFWAGFSKQRKKPNWRISSNWVQNAFFDFPHRGEKKKHRWDRIARGRFHTTILGGLFQAAQKAELTIIVKLCSKRVFRLSPSLRNEKTPLGSNCTRSVSYHHFGWAFPSSAKSRIDEYRQIEIKTRFSTFLIGTKRKNTLGIEIHEVGFIPPFLVGFSKQRKKPNWRISSNWVQNAFFDFPHRNETKKHRWDRIARGRLHTTILGGLFQAAQEAKLTIIVKLSSKHVFLLSPSERNEKTPLGSNSTRSVSYHYFGWAFPSSPKSRIDEYRQIEIKTRFSTFPIVAKRKNTLGIEIHEVGYMPVFWVGFSKQRKKPNWRISSNWVQNAFFDFPHRGETKKHRWDRIARGRFPTTILGGLFQAAQKAELTIIVKLSSKRVFRLSPSGRNEKTPLGSKSTRSVSYHHFGWAFPSSAKSRIDDYRQIEFKRRFSTFPIGAKQKNIVGIKLHEVSFIPPFWVGFSKQRKKPNWRLSSNWVQNAFLDFPHRGETKKHRWDQIARGRFHTTILGGLFQAAQKAELTIIVKLSSKRVFRLSPSGRNEKTPLGSKSTRSVSYHHFGWAFPSSAKSRIDDYRQIEFKRRFSTFPIGAKQKNIVGIKLHEVGFIPPFWVGFSKQRKKPNWRISSNWVQNAFFDFPHRGETKKHRWDQIARGGFHTTILGGLFKAAQKAELTNIVKLSSKRVFWVSPSERNEKTPLGSNCTRSVSYHYFGWAFPSSARSRIDDYRQIEFKTRFSTFPIAAKRKNTVGIKLHDVGFIPPFWVGFSKQRKMPSWRISSNWVQNAFFDFPHRCETKKKGWDRIARVRFHTIILGGLFQAAQKAELTNIVKFSSKPVFRHSPSGRNEKTPLGSKSTRSVSYHNFGWAFPSSAKSRIDEYRQIEFKTRFSTFPIGAKRKNTVGIELHEVGSIPLFWVGFSKQRKKPNWRISSNWVQNAFFDFPHRNETKKHRWDRIARGRFHTTILGGRFQAAQEAELTIIVKLSSKRVFLLSPSLRNEKTPLGSNCTMRVSYHHFGWAFPSSAKSRIDEYRQIEFKTRFSTFPIGAKRKNTLGIEIHDVGFIPPFWVGFSKQRKKPSWRISSNWVQNAFFDFPHRCETKKKGWDRISRVRFHTIILGGLFQAAQKAELTNIVKLSSKGVFRLSPAGRNEKTPLGSKSRRSVSYHHFGWAFPSNAKSRIDEYCKIEFKTRFSTFPIGAKRKNTVGIEFHDVGFIPLFWVGFSKQRKKPNWRISSNWDQNAFFDIPHRGETKKHPWDRNPRGWFHTTILGGLFQAAQKAELTNIVKLRSKRVFRHSLSGRNEKTSLGSKSTRSVSYHYFGWAFPSSAKRRIDEYREIEFKMRFSTFPSGAKRKNTVGIELHEVGFVPLFWVGFSKQRKKPNWQLSSNWVQNAFIDFPHRGETKKQSWDQIARGRFHTTILGGLFQAAQKADLNEYRQIEFKRRLSTFPIGAKRKSTLWIELHEVGLIPLFWVCFSRQR